MSNHYSAISVSAAKLATRAVDDGWDLFELAEDLGVNYTTLENIVTGRTIAPPKHTWNDLCFRCSLPDCVANNSRATPTDSRCPRRKAKNKGLTVIQALNGAGKSIGLLPK